MHQTNDDAVTREHRDTVRQTDQRAIPAPRYCKWPELPDGGTIVCSSRVEPTWFSLAYLGSKTHLAIAFGCEACPRGCKVRFFAASRLVNTYIEAGQEQMVLKLEECSQRCDLIFADELGYVPLDRMSADVWCLLPVLRVDPRDRDDQSALCGLAPGVRG